MIFKALESLNTDRFLKYLLQYGIAIILIFIVGVLILHFWFNWRPILNARYKIANLIRKEPYSELSLVGELCWWIIYFAPYVLVIILGFFICINLSPKVIGIDILIIPIFTMMLIFTYMNYSKSGNKLTTLARVSLSSVALVFFALTVIHQFIVKNRTWRSDAIANIWPPVWFFVFSMCIARLRLNTQTVSKTVENDKIEGRMLFLIGKGTIHPYTTEYKFSRIIVRFGGSGIAGLLTLILNVLFAVRNKANSFTMFSTLVLFIILDAVSILGQNMAFESENLIPLMCFIMVFKVITVYLAEKYYILNQCLILITLGVYFLSHIFQGLFNQIHGVAPIVQKPDRVDPQVLNAIKNYEAKNTAYKVMLKVIYSIFCVVLIIALIAEIYTLDIQELAPLLKYNGDTLEEYWVIVSVIIAAIFTALVIGMHFTDAEYGMHGTIFNIFPVILLLLIFVFMLSFMLGLHLNFVDLRTYISIGWSFLMINILLKRTTRLHTVFSLFTDTSNAFGRYWVSTLYGAIVVILTICHFCFIYLHGTTNHLCIVIYCAFVLIFCGYNFATIADTPEKKKLSIIYIVAMVITGFVIFGVAVHKFGAKYPILVAGLLVYFFIVYCVYNRVKSNRGKMKVMHLIATLVGFVVALITTIVASALKLRIYDHIIYQVIIVPLWFISIFYFDGRMIEVQTSHIIATVYSVIVFASFCVKVQEPYWCILYLLSTIYVFVFLYVVRVLRSAKRGYSYVFSSIFFPVNLYGNSHIETVDSLLYCFCYMFYAPWIYGIITMTYTDLIELAFFMQGFGFVVPFFLACSHIMSSDLKTVHTLEFVEMHTLSHAVKCALKASSVDFHNNKEAASFFTYDEFIRFVDNDTNGDAQKYKYMMALKGQLSVSYEICSGNLISTIKNYLDQCRARWDFLDRENLRVEDFVELFNVYKAIEAKNKEFKKLQNALIEQTSRITIARYTHHVHAVERYEKTKKYYDEALSYMAKANVLKYDDPQYPPQAEIRASDENLLVNCVWKNADTFFTGPFIREFRSDDLVCGDVEDSYFIAVLAALSRDRSIIEALFKQPVRHDRGIYAVHFNFLGKDIFSVVDNKIPIEGGFAKLSAPCSASSSAWFCSIVEKAYSKICGGFAGMASGYCATAFSLLCDGFSETFDLTSDIGIELRENGEMFNKIMNTIEKGGFVCASKFDPTTPKKCSYAIFNAVEYKNYQMVRLRNPYNIDEDSIIMPKDSSKWAEVPELRNLCHISPHDDGTFWMPFSEFVHSFRFLFTFDRLLTWYMHEIKSSFTHNGNDGAHPYEEGTPDMTHVHNLQVRFTKPTNIKAVLERSGASTNVKAYLTANYGQPVTRIFFGRDFRHANLGAKSSMVSFEWYIDKVDYPWTLTVTRIASEEPCDYRLRLYSDRDIEVTEMDISQFIEDYDVTLPEIHIRKEVPEASFNT